MKENASQPTRKHREGGSTSQNRLPEDDDEGRRAAGRFGDAAPHRATSLSVKQTLNLVRDDSLPKFNSRILPRAVPT
jgi:hypothetical protein